MWKNGGGNGEDKFNGECRMHIAAHAIILSLSRFQQPCFWIKMISQLSFSLCPKVGKMAYPTVIKKYHSKTEGV